METSKDRILTTHTGSLPRPASLTDLSDSGQVRAAVEETVRRQRQAGIDIVNDGEVSKPSYATYVTERLSGFDGEALPPAVERPRDGGLPRVLREAAGSVRGRHPGDPIVHRPGRVHGPRQARG